MNAIHLLALTAMVFSLFTSKSSATPELDFWKWFRKNEESLFNFEKTQDKTFARLTAEMKKINPSLTFEFGPIKDNRREFVISADGIKNAFPTVERLTSEAPSLDRWIWIKFRQRRTPMDIEYEGVRVKADDVFCTVEADGDKVGITIYIRGIQPAHEKTYHGISFLMLDQALGEYDVETKVGFIETLDFSANSKLEKKPLKSISKAFDDIVAHQKKNG